MQKKKGLVLLELILVIVLLCLLAALYAQVVYTAVQKTKVGIAQSQIAHIAGMLEMVKDDTSYYPVSLEDCIKKDSPEGMARGWRGPYCGLMPLDPWQTAYFYIIPPTEIFDVPPIIRGAGHPETYTINFHSAGGTGRIRIENYGVASSTLDINGVRIFNQSYFKNTHPQPDIFEKDVTFQTGNNSMTCYIASGPTRYYLVYLSGYFPTGEYFILGSYGKDGLKGGHGFNTDFGWRSDIYPNFLEEILE